MITCYCRLIALSFIFGLCFVSLGLVNGLLLGNVSLLGGFILDFLGVRRLLVLRTMDGLLVALRLVIRVILNNKLSTIVS